MIWKKKINYNQVNDLFFLSVSKVCARLIGSGVYVQGVSVQGVSVQGGICPGGKCPGGYMSGGKCLGGTCPTAPNHMIWEIRIGVVFLRRCGLPI